MMKGLYKNDNNTLMFAQLKVSYPNGITLIVSDYAEHEGEIYDGWYWFNNRDEAKVALGIIDIELTELKKYET